MSDNEYRVHYAKATYGDEEKSAVHEVLANPAQLVGGPATETFQSRLSDLFGKEHGIMVNSGSSANLLAVELLDLDSGSEVVTPIVTFSTTVAPLVQNDLIPVFVDIGVGDYQIDIEQVRGAITDATEAILVPSLVGNIPDYRILRELANEHDLYLIEDSADTLGATIDGIPTGAFTDISTTSFYASHVMTTLGTGGLVAVNDDAWMRRAKKLRGWGRKSAAEETDNIDDRFVQDLDGTPYDSKFVFDEIGYNFLPTEVSAAFGVEQLKKLPDFSETRRRNFRLLREFFEGYDEWFVLPEEHPDVDTTWLAFPLTIKEEAPFDRTEVVTHLEKNGVQTRSLWTGNILNHPGFEDIDARLPYNKYPNADYVSANAFVVGAHQSMDDDDVGYVLDVVRDLLEQY